MKKFYELLTLSGLFAMTVAAVNVNVSHEFKRASAESVTYTDDQLEYYDTVSLKDIGLGESLTNTAVFETERPNDIKNTYMASEANTTGSVKFQFYYEATEILPESGNLHIRMRGNNAWNYGGFQFVLSTSGAEHGYVIIAEGKEPDEDAAFRIGDAPMDLTPGVRHYIELSVINLKGSTDVLITTTCDGVVGYNSVYTPIRAHNDSRISFYSGSTGTGSYTISSTTAEPKFINAGKASYVLPNGTAGFYFTLNTTANNLPVGPDWSTRFGSTSKFAAAINKTEITGERVVCHFHNSANGGWYLALSDYGISPKKGDIVTFGGLFSNYENGKKTVIKIELSAFEYTNENWVEIPDFKQYLKDKLVENIDYEVYNESGLEAVNNAVNAAVTGIDNASDVSQIWEAYETGKATIDAVEPDEAYFEEKLAQAKLAACEELDLYLNPNKYEEDVYPQVESLVAKHKGIINACTSLLDVRNALTAAKQEINAIKTLEDAIVEKVNNRVTGYEEYLEPYDVVTLRDFAVGDEVVSTEFGGEDFNNDGDLGVFNSFMPSPLNTTGSMRFQAYYESTAIGNTKYGANFFIRIRGVNYFGYRLCLGTSSGGVTINSMFNDQNSTTLFKRDGIFSGNTSYKIEFSSIDLKGYEKTLVQFTVNGEVLYHEVVDSLPGYKNPRLSIADSHTEEGSGITARLTSCLDGITTLTTCEDVGYANISEAGVGDANGFYFSTNENNVPFDSTWELSAYPLTKDAVKVNGNDAAVIQTTAIKKIDTNTYYLALRDFDASVKDGDEVVIEGTFTTFNTETKEKYNFSIKKSTFVYQNGTWSKILSLEESKIEAIDSLNKYADLSNYSDDNKVLVEQAIANGISAINAATTKDEVATALANAKAAIDAIRTLFEDYKENAKEEVNNYKVDQINNYREEQKQEIANIKSQACSNIDVASTKEVVDALVNQAKDAIDAVKTDAALSEEELIAAKTAAKQEIRDYYGAIDLTRYSETNVAAINELAAKALKDVEAATSIQEVNDIVNKFKQDVDAIKPASKGGCGGSIIATSMMIATLSVAGAGMLFIKRKEK